MKKTLTLFALSALLISCAIVALSVTTKADTGLNSLDARLALLPSDAGFLVSVDIDSLKRSPLYAKYSEMHEKGLEHDHACFQNLVNETGLDPRKDLDTLLLASRTAGDDDSQTLGVVTGRFDTERIEARLKKDGFAVEKKNGQTIFMMKKDQKDLQPDFSLAFLGRDAVVFGAAPTVREAVGRYKSGADGGFMRSPGNRELVSSLDGHSQIFGFVRTAQVMEHVGAIAGPGGEGLPAALGSLKSVDVVSFSVGIDADVDVTAHALCGKAENAALVHDAIKGFLAMGKLAAQDKEKDLASALDLAQVTNEGTSVSFSLRLPADLIDRWHKTMEEHRNLRQPPAEQHEAEPDHEPAATQT